MYIVYYHLKFSTLHFEARKKKQKTNILRHANTREKRFIFKIVSKNIRTSSSVKYIIGYLKFKSLITRPKIITKYMYFNNY